MGGNTQKLCNAKFTICVGELCPYEKMFHLAAVHIAVRVSW